MMMLAKMLLAMLLASAYLSPAAAEVLRLDYEGFTIWLDCDRRGAVKFRYNAQRDQGDFKRYKSFYLDPNVPKRCQQTSTASYKHTGARYDRGHLVPATTSTTMPRRSSRAITWPTSCPRLPI